MRPACLWFAGVSAAAVLFRGGASSPLLLFAPPCPSPCLLRLQAQINLLRLSYDYRLLAKQEHPITVMQQHYQQMQRLFDLCLDKKATAVIAFFNEWMQQQASAIVIELEKEEE